MYIQKYHRVKNFLLIISSLLICFVSEGAVIRVRLNGDDSLNGDSWVNAKRTIAAAMNSAVSGDEVWVARGIYVERITLKAGVKLYGGFTGTENSPAERSAFPRPTPDPDETILDGNAGGSVIIVESDALPETTRIDGFTIRNGKAEKGGGIYCVNASPTIINNIIKENSAIGQPPPIYYVPGKDGYGGGIYCNDHASPIISNNIIIQNKVTGPYGASSAGVGSGYAGNIGYGGGIFCGDNSSPLIIENAIKSNQASGGTGGNSSPGSRPTSGGAGGGGLGGGICLVLSSAIITSNTITENHTLGGNGGSSGNGGGGKGGDGLGGGIYSSDSSLQITSNKIDGNKSFGGAGGYGGSFGGPSQQADGGNGYGSAIYTELSPTTLVSSNYIYSNFAEGGAGSVMGDNNILHNSGTIINCLVYANMGNGAYNTGTIINCTFFKNNGLGIENDGSVINCIIWENPEGDIKNNNKVHFSCYREATGELGNIAKEPLFINTSGEINTWNLRISPESPCVDGGTSDGAPVSDMAGISRPQGEGFDMGAYESRFSKTYVEGLILDPDTSKPVNGATVQIDGGTLRTFTDAKGNFRLYGVTSAPHKLQCWSFAFEFDERDIMPADSPTSVGVILLSKINGTVVGRLTDSETGEPLAAAIVQLDGGNKWRTLTDEQGYFMLIFVTSGEHKLQAWSYAYSFQEHSIQVNEDGPTDVGSLSFDIIPDTVRGRIIDAKTGRPVMGAQAQFDGGGAGKETQTNINGRFILINVPAGYRQLQTWGWAYSFAQKDFAQTAGTATDLGQIQIEPIGGTVNGRLLDAVNGLPVYNAVVQLDGGNYGSWKTSSLLNGDFIVYDVTGGTHQFQTWGWAYRFLEQAIECVAGENKGMGDIAMTPDPNTINGRVLDAQTQLPIEGATIILASGGLNITSKSFPDGRFVLLGVRWGTYDITIENEGYYLVHLKTYHPGENLNISVGDVLLPKLD